LVAVFHSDLNLVKVIENIELGKVESRVAVDFVRILDNDQVKPSASAFSSSGNAELLANYL
jgi:hypothetical protein